MSNKHNKKVLKDKPPPVHLRPHLLGVAGWWAGLGWSRGGFAGAAT